MLSLWFSSYQYVSQIESNFIPQRDVFMHDEAYMTYPALYIYNHFADAQYRYGDIHLEGGSYQWEGRVEIFISGTWGTITDSEWTNKDAQVVCRKLGHFKPGIF